jgi:hypothetical protein
VPESPRSLDVVALVERLVRESGIPDAGERDELRRELLSHFDEAGASPEARRAAIERFGNAHVITEGFRHAYRRGRRALYAAKIVVAFVACSVVALAFQTIIGLPFTMGAPRPHAAFDPVITTVFSVVLVLVGVAAWEMGSERLCTRLERRPIALLTTFAALFAAAHVTHSVIATFSNPAHDLAASTMTIATWMSTIAILSHVDVAFLRLFGVSARK